MAPAGWINLDPEPVPDNDPRIQAATLVADGAWVGSTAPTTAGRMRDVVRAVLGHIDDTYKDW
jgi:tartrate dehydratase beta subunit/fumarate hydratase class I family protein